MSYKYDIAISYVSNDVCVAEDVKNLLEQDGWKVFYAPDKQELMIARTLKPKLYNIYKNESRHILALVSDDYLDSEYAMEEAQIAMLRHRREERCLIPIYMDDTTLPGLSNEVVYFRSRNPYEIAITVDCILKETIDAADAKSKKFDESSTLGAMYICGNTARNQQFIQNATFTTSGKEPN